METTYLNNQLREVELIIKQKRITTLLQPIISLKNGKVLGYEALSRGPKNTEYYNPQKLFEVARENNLLWDLELVCRLKALEKCLNRLEGKKLFINIDPNIIQDSKFSGGFTKDILKKYKIDPDDIIFEITENTAIKDYKKLRSVLDNYSYEGYKIAIDDTGSGHSGLILLAETQPNFVKIDRELVSDIDKNRFKQDIINIFHEFSKTANIQIIAEGIETEGELQTLIDLGIQYGQGYLIQKPDENIMPISDNIIKLIEDCNSRRELLSTVGTDDYQIGYLARRDQAIDVSTSVDEINDIFSYQYSLQGIPIVNNEKPVGLVMRNKFYYQLAKRGTEELRNKPIRQLMTKLPLIVDFESPLTKVVSVAMSRREEAIYDYVIVSKDGKYYGTVPVVKMIEALSKGKKSIKGLLKSNS